MKWMRWMAVTCVFLMALAGAANAVSVGEQTRHFEIYYAGSMSGSDNNGVGLALENAYGDINGYFGTCPGQIKVLVVGKKTMDRVGEHVEAFSAWNTKSSTIVLREETVKDKKSLDVVARHEICHLALNNIMAQKKSKEFAWMEEGVCIVLSNEPFSDVKVSKYIVGKGFLSPKEIADAVEDEKYEISKNGYMQSYSLVKYMVMRFGASAVVNMLKCPETDFEKAFMMYTGVDFGTFYRQWESYVKNIAAGGQAAVMPSYGYLSFDLYLEDCAACSNYEVKQSIWGPGY